MEDEEEITEEQLTELRVKAAKVDELEKSKAEVDGKLKEYEEDKNVINWRNAREKEKRLEKALKDAGKDVDDDGNIIEKQAGVSQEDVTRIAREQAETMLVERSITKAKNQLNDDDKATFDKYYTKAISGETVNADNVDEFIDLAMRLAGGGNKGGSGGMTRGAPPRLAEREEGFGDTEAGKGLAGKMGIKI